MNGGIQGRIPCLVPDLPNSQALMPWLQIIDRNLWYTNFGPLTLELETRLASLLTDLSQVDSHVLCTSCGTSALETALSDLNLPTNANILLPSFTFPATASAVIKAGLQPVFCDVDPSTWQLTPEIAAATLQHVQVQAVVTVATFGVRQDGQAWRQFQEDHQVPVVIDAAAAWGTQELSDGLTVVFSLHATKPFGIGEGGLIASTDPDMIRRCRKHINFGFEATRTVGHSGFNGKLSEYAGAVGLAQLERWPKIQALRSHLWAYYQRELAALEPQISRQIGTNTYPPAVACLQFPYTTEKAVEYLASAGIETRRWYCPATHQHPAYRHVPRYSLSGTGTLAVSDQLSKCILGIPFHTQLSESQIEYIGKHLEHLHHDIQSPHIAA